MMSGGSDWSSRSRMASSETWRVRPSVHRSKVSLGCRSTVVITGFASEPPTALLSHRFWSSRFASDPQIVGSDLHLSGERYRVIGVLPEDTEFLDPSLEVFSPIRLGPPDETKRDNRSLTMFGRLDDGVSIAQADQEMQALSAALIEDHPRANRGRKHAVTPIRDRLVPPNNRNLMGLIWQRSLWHKGSDCLPSTYQKCISPII